MRVRFAGFPKNMERRERIHRLISSDNAQGNVSGLNTVRMQGLVGEYLKEEREAHSRAFRKRKTCFKPKEHTQPCYCANMARAKAAMAQEEPAA